MDRVIKQFVQRAVLLLLKFLRYVVIHHYIARVFDSFIMEALVIWINSIFREEEEEGGQGEQGGEGSQGGRHGGV